MKLKDLVLVGNELNELLFDPSKKKEGWIETKGTTETKVITSIKEAIVLLAADDTLTEETLITLREVDWKEEDFEKEEESDQIQIKQTLQGMGIWLAEEVEEVGEEETAPTPKKKAPVKKAEVIVEEDTQILTLRDNAKAELAQIKTIEGGIEYLHKVQSIATWMQAEKKDAELQNMVAEQKLRTQRILGELIQQGQDDGDIATQSSHGKGIQKASVSQGNTPKTLDEIGVSRKQSSMYKQIADIPEKEFDSFITEKKEAVDLAVSELTTKGAVQLSKNLKKKSDTSQKSEKSKKEFDNEDALLAIAEKINTEYSKKERQFIVKHIKV